MIKWRNNMKKLLLSLQNNDNDYCEEHLDVEYLYSFLRVKNIDIDVLYTCSTTEALSYVIDHNIEVVIFSIFDYRYEYMSLYFKEAMQFASDIKSYNSNIQIIFFGYTAYMYAEKCFEIGNFDYILQGEPEANIIHLLTALDNNDQVNSISGLIFKKNGHIIRNQISEYREALDEMYCDNKQIYNFSVPQITFGQVEKIMSNPYREEMVLSSVGCTRNCTFCTDPRLPVCKKWRGREIKSIVNEIEKLYENQPFSILRFTDSSFEDNDCLEKRCILMANELISRKLDIIYCVNFRTTFYKYLNKDNMEILKKSGLNMIYLGIESFNESDLLLFKKGCLDDVYRSIAYVKELGFNIDIGFINFHPYSTMEGIRHNADLLHKYRFSSLSHYLHKLMVVKGTEIYDKIEKDGLLLPDNSNNITYSNYVFVNDSVAELWLRIDKLKNDDRIKEVLQKSELYTCFFYNFIASVKMKFGKDIKCSNDYNQFLAQLNDTIYDFFLHLLCNNYKNIDLSIDSMIDACRLLDKYRKDIEKQCEKQDKEFIKRILKYRWIQ